MHTRVEHDQPLQSSTGHLQLAIASFRVDLAVEGIVRGREACKVIVSAKTSRRPPEGPPRPMSRRRKFSPWPGSPGASLSGMEVIRIPFPHGRLPRVAACSIMQHHAQDRYFLALVPLRMAEEMASQGTLCPLLVRCASDVASSSSHPATPSWALSKTPR